MDDNKKLDEALGFLRKMGEYSDGSFLWYDYPENDEKDSEGKSTCVNFRNKPELKEEDTRLAVYLKQIGVPESEIYPIIFHLIDDEYVKGTPGSTKSPYKPSQIKILFSGILLLNNNGYHGLRIHELEQLKREKDLIDSSIRAANAAEKSTANQQKSDYRTFFIGIVGAVVAAAALTISILMYNKSENVIDLKPIEKGLQKIEQKLNLISLPSDKTKETLDTLSD